MKVLVVPEDPTYNGYILKPLVERLLRSAGKPNARVMVLTSPSAQGYEMIKAELPGVFERYRYLDLIVFLPDLDCDENREDEFQTLQQKADASGAKFLACAAVQEVEAWLLAGHAEKLPAGWQTVRADCDLKERYFEPFLKEYGDNSAGGGRQRLMRETLQNLAGLLERCPELKGLLARIEEKLAA